MIPPPVVEIVDGILVVRDDLIIGGTKRRAIKTLIGHWHEYVYASPVQGFAQVALALAARDAGKKATVFCAKRSQRHELTIEAESFGAEIIEVPNARMNVVKARARAYCLETGAKLLPFGLNDPAFIEALADVARALNVQPVEVWSVSGSGVLTRALQLAWPDAACHAVKVGAKSDIGRATEHVAPEPFDQDAKEPPPFPSCRNYDAKAWQFVRRLAKPGALFWNVAR